jgi:hypothetical protein
MDDNINEAYVEDVQVDAAAVTIDPLPEVVAEPGDGDDEFLFVVRLESSSTSAEARSIQAERI